MSKVSPFHSIKPNASNVHHDNNKCTEGNNIEKQNVKNGTAGRPLCDRCSQLGREGK